jgi:hypothetical protein
LVSAYGDFDHRTGGHLILWDLNLLIEFPPDYTICLPSALFVHSNVPLAREEETRHSITSFTAAGIFRWVAFGMKTKAESSSEDIKKVAKKWYKKEFKEGIKTWTKLADLLEDFEIEAESTQLIEDPAKQTRKLLEDEKKKGKKRALSVSDDVVPVPQYSKVTRYCLRSSSRNQLAPEV